jgi:redox-sensitive bicupin YhaK (pirin superfamily)
MTAILETFRLGFQWPVQNPFLFCVHHLDHYPAGDPRLGVPSSRLGGRPLGQDFEPRDGFRMYHGRTVPGFPVHPHRGFETLTAVRSGWVDHADSLGAAGRYGAGDLQWMTAGAGLQHSEMFPLLDRERDNPLELFQVWLNLPAARKMVEPHYRMFWRDETPSVAASGGAGKLEVLAGCFGDVQAPAAPPASWAADPANEVAVWLLTLADDASLMLPPAGDGVGRMLYVYEGEGLEVGASPLAAGRGARLDARLSVTVRAPAARTCALVLQGRPIDEPVVQHGPFVMNSEQEIRQAFLDYQRTNFGGWPWDRPDMVFPAERGRFAHYADGREEFPNDRMRHPGG